MWFSRERQEKSQDSGTRALGDRVGACRSRYTEDLRVAVPDPVWDGSFRATWGSFAVILLVL